MSLLLLLSRGTFKPAQKPQEVYGHGLTTDEQAARIFRQNKILIQAITAMAATGAFNG